MARVLVVDDDPSIRELIKLACELDSHEVQAVFDAVGAAEAYATFRPELMILDMNMPGGGADYVVELLRERGFSDLCPWILVTGDVRAREEGTREKFEAGEVISKPFSLDSLRMAVKTTLAG